MKKMTSTSPRNSPHLTKNRQGNRDLLTPIQGEEITIKVEDKSTGRRDSESLYSVETIEENTDLPNRNCRFFIPTGRLAGWLVW